MSEKNPDIVTAFTERHQFTIMNQLRDDEQVILWLADIKSSLDAAITAETMRLVANKEPTWMILWSMQDRRFYIGYTENVERRFGEHQNGEVTATKFRRPLRLIYFESYCEQKDALGREKFLKSGSGHRYLKKQLSCFLNKCENIAVP